MQKNSRLFDGKKTTEGGKIPRHPFIHSVEWKNRTGQEFNIGAILTASLSQSAAGR
jgi:hypothetical protein